MFGYSVPFIFPLNRFIILQKSIGYKVPGKQKSWLFTPEGLKGTDHHTLGMSAMKLNPPTSLNKLLSTMVSRILPYKSTAAMLKWVLDWYWHATDRKLRLRAIGILPRSQD